MAEEIETEILQVYCWEFLLEQSEMNDSYRFLGNLFGPSRTTKRLIKKLFQLTEK